jgi:hypothetical protein
MPQGATATITIKGISPYSQSRPHNEPKLQGERPDAYDLRTWRSKLNTDTRDGKPTVVIPAHGVHQAITAAARYVKKQIAGQGRATYAKKFEAGIALLEDPSLNIDPEAVKHIAIYANVNGKRGVGARVLRRFPDMPVWAATFEVWIIDPIITEDVFRETVEAAGMFIGLGRFRPECGGSNGRFAVERLDWEDKRELVFREAA